MKYCYKVFRVRSKTKLNPISAHLALRADIIYQKEKWNTPYLPNSRIFAFFNKSDVLDYTKDLDSFTRFSIYKCQYIGKAISFGERSLPSLSEDYPTFWKNFSYLTEMVNESFNEYLNVCFQTPPGTILVKFLKPIEEIQ
ncbi:MAG: hypothetical protein IPM51_11755 [Sphingobacteriaceae bacterium]|nr:hypothetical protein [Sphingobacteriaceae bacterium]